MGVHPSLTTEGAGDKGGPPGLREPWFGFTVREMGEDHVAGVCRRTKVKSVAGKVAAPYDAEPRTDGR